MLALNVVNRGTMKGRAGPQSQAHFNVTWLVITAAWLLKVGLTIPFWTQLYCWDSTLRLRFKATSGEMTTNPLPVTISTSTTSTAAGHAGTTPSVTPHTGGPGPSGISTLNSLITQMVQSAMALSMQSLLASVDTRIQFKGQRPPPVLLSDSPRSAKVQRGRLGAVWYKLPQMRSSLLRRELGRHQPHALATRICQR